MPYDMPAQRCRPWPPLPAAQMPATDATAQAPGAAQTPYGPRVVRLAVGLEALPDLQADLAQALGGLD